MRLFPFKKKWILYYLSILSGCVSLPKEQQTENLLAPPSIGTSIENGLGSGYFAVGDWPQENWWETFQSEKLNSLIEEGLGQNPTIQAIKSRVAFAKQTAKVVRSQLFPLIFFDADETWQYLSHHGLYRTLNHKVPINANLVDLTLSCDYEFDFWGKNRHLFNAALGESKAEEAEAAEVRLLISTAIAQAFFALKTNLTRKYLYEELFKVRQATFQLQALLLEKALLSQLEPLLSVEQVLDAEKLLIGIEEEVETDKHLLNILLGRSPDAFLEVGEGLPPFQANLNLPENLSIDLLSRRPDLMAQIWRVEALAHEVGAAKADFYPNINLKALIGLESVLYRFLFQSHSKTAALQPAIHLPIFTAGAIRANVRAKKALFDQAVFDYNNLLLKSSQEVADLLIFTQTIFQQKADQEQILNAAKARYDLTILRAQKGLDNSLSEYYVAEELIQKQLEDVTLLYNQYLAAVKLIKALGGGYQSEYALPLKGNVTHG